jgi:predicted enzyme related to lactoylglutathione lyase
VEFLLRPGGPPPAAGQYEDSACGIVLYTKDLDATAVKLAEAGLVFKGTVDSDRCLTFRDPDGNWFQLVDPQEF